MLVYEFPLNWRFKVLNSMLGWDVGEHDEKLRGFLELFWIDIVSRAIVLEIYIYGE
jgi:hypothetical protein